MDLGLTGKRALVTGATKGIGRAIAETLIAEGCAVSICARTDADVQEAVMAMGAGGGQVWGTAVDVADPTSLRSWIATSAEQLGGIDIYVHNTSAKPARKIEGWEKNFQVDLMSLVHGVDAAKAHLVEGGGSLISISTTATSEHFAMGASSYSAFKSAVSNWTLGQAQTLGAQGVRCNVVSPGPIFVEGGDWDGIKQAMAAFYESTEKHHPGGKLGTTQDVANAVAFLASPVVSAHINGANLTVDGGFLKRIDF